MAPIGVDDARMSMIAGAPPQMIGEPGRASWWMTIPLRHSAACWTTDPTSVTGAAPPASGIETISAGTRARARSTRLCAPNSDQLSGGEGQTSKTARGRVASASRPPESIARRSIITCVVRALNAPVTTGLSEYSRTRKSRYRSPISGGTSPQTIAVDWAA
jgi:hypothetical protein